MVLHHLADTLFVESHILSGYKNILVRGIVMSEKLKHGELAEFLGQGEFEAVKTTAEAVKFL